MTFLQCDDLMSFRLSRQIHRHLGWRVHDQAAFSSFNAGYNKKFYWMQELYFIFYLLQRKKKHLYLENSWISIFMPDVMHSKWETMFFSFPKGTFNLKIGLHKKKKCFKIDISNRRIKDNWVDPGYNKTGVFQCVSTKKKLVLKKRQYLELWRVNPTYVTQFFNQTCSLMEDLNLIKGEFSSLHNTITCRAKQSTFVRERI